MAISISEDTVRLLEEYSGDFQCTELLQFFGRYPYTRFNRLAIIHALNNSNTANTEKALKRLTDDGLLNVYSQNNVTFFRLKNDDSVRRTIIEFASLNWPQRRIVLRNIYEILAEKQKNIEIKPAKRTFRSFAPPIFHPVTPLLTLATG